MPALHQNQPLLFPGGSELGQSLLSYPPCPFCHMGNKISEAVLSACIGDVSFWGALEVQSYSGGSLDEILREALLQERRPNMAFPNSTLTQLQLGVLTHLPPPCHYAGAELSCSVGQGPRRKCHHSASSGWAPFFSSTHVT